MTRGLNRRVARIGARLNVAQLPVARVWDLLRLGLVSIARLSDTQLEDIASGGPVNMSALTDDQLRRIATGEPVDAVVSLEGRHHPSCTDGDRY
jgi:hypothetical protein